MKRRGRASEQRVKGGARGATGSKARKAPITHVSTTDLQEQVGALTRELKEARDQQTATSEVLRVISSSPGELEPVFQTLLGNATRLCMADFGFMFHYKDGFFQLMAQRGADPAYVVLAETRSDRLCLVERSGFGVRYR